MPRADLPPWALSTRSSHPVLSGRARCDVTVVGAGVAGLSLALHLVRPGIEVAVLEADLVGARGSARGNGMALPGTPEHYGCLCEAIGRAATRQWWQMATEGVDSLTEILKEHRLDCAWTRGGALALAGGEVELAEMTRAAREQGEDGFEPRLMGAAAATNYVPVADCEGALYLPGAVCLDPARALTQLAGLAAKRGVRIFERSPGHQIQVGPEQVVVRSSQGEMACEIAVVAAGHRTCELLSTGGLFPLCGQSFSTAPVREGPRGATPAVSCNRGHEMYRRLPDGGMVASGINPGSGPQEKTADREADAAFQGFLQETAYRRFPEMARVEVRDRWSTIYTYSFDGLPLVGPLPGHHRVHVLAGFASRSWSLGFGAGRALARVLAGAPANLPPGSSPRRWLRESAWQ